MATVKILYNDTAEKLETYLKTHVEQAKSEGKEMLLTEHSVFLDGMTKEFFQVQSDFNTRGNNALHLIQSWSPTESKLLKPEAVHEMGIEMAKRFAPGHQFVVQTHTDQAHYHNHVVINPVNLETGKRIQNKLENIRTIRNINDQIAKERGLSVLPPQEKLRRPGPNERAKRVETYRGKSYIVDLSNKANFARNYATNYDEYLSILGGFNIEARIENQNITYFYPGRPGKRGRNLAPILDKPSLEKKFEQNRDLVKNSPELQSTLAELITPHRNPSTIMAHFTSGNRAGDLVSNRKEGITQPRKEILDQSVIPLEEIQKAKTRSILKYCEKEKIRLTQTAEGKTVLKDREHVEVSEYSWTNHRNKTRGTAIDFVANHRSTSFLHAVSILNDNPNLMLLEKNIGAVNRSYHSFNIPKGDPANRAESIKHLAKFLGHSSGSDRYASIFKSQSVLVTQDYRIRFFTEKNYTGYLEYIPDGQGEYRRQIQGEIRSPYLNQKGRGEEITLFLEPKTLLKYRPTAFERSSARREGTLALLEPNIAIIHQAIAAEKNLKRIRIVRDPLEPESVSKDVLKFFDELRESLDPFSIDTSMAWVAAPQEMRDINPRRGREHSIDIFEIQ